jgi:hypothetical protein
VCCLVFLRFYAILKPGTCAPFKHVLRNTAVVWLLAPVMLSAPTCQAYIAIVTPCLLAPLASTMYCAPTRQADSALAAPRIFATLASTMSDTPTCQADRALFTSCLLAPLASTMCCVPTCQADSASRTPAPRSLPPPCAVHRLVKPIAPLSQPVSSQRLPPRCAAHPVQHRALLPHMCAPLSNLSLNLVLSNLQTFSLLFSTKPAGR